MIFPFLVLAFLQQSPQSPVIVKIVETKEPGVADVLIGALGITGVLILGAVVVGVLLGGAMFYFRSRQY